MSNPVFSQKVIDVTLNDFNNYLATEEKRIQQVTEKRARIRQKLEELLPYYLNDYTLSKYKNLVDALLELNICLTWEQMND